MTTPEADGIDWRRLLAIVIAATGAFLWGIALAAVSFENEGGYVLARTVEWSLPLLVVAFAAWIRSPHTEDSRVLIGAFVLIALTGALGAIVGLALSPIPVASGIGALVASPVLLAIALVLWPRSRRARLAVFGLLAFAAAAVCGEAAWDLTTEGLRGRLVVALAIASVAFVLVAGGLAWMWRDTRPGR